MESLNSLVQEYTRQLSKGQIQKAYRGIMTFMSGLKSHLDGHYPNYATSALYFGYMDMSYFAFTPPELREKKLKIAIVYLHEEGRFDAWLGGNNRHIQAAVIEQLSHKDLGGYQLSQVQPGVDSIIETLLVAQPDFDQPDALEQQIETRVVEFAEHMMTLLDQ